MLDFSGDRTHDMIIWVLMYNKLQGARRLVYGATPYQIIFSTLHGTCYILLSLNLSSVAQCQLDSRHYSSLVATKLNVRVVGVMDEVN